MRTQKVTRLSVHRTPKTYLCSDNFTVGDTVLASASTLDGSLQAIQLVILMQQKQLVS